MFSSEINFHFQIKDNETIEKENCDSYVLLLHNVSHFNISFLIFALLKLFLQRKTSIKFSLKEGRTIAFNSTIKQKYNNNNRKKNANIRSFNIMFAILL